MKIAKAFGVPSLPVGGSTTLTFQVQNPNAISESGITFIDNLPAGLVVSTPNGLTGTCGVGTIVATAGSSTIGLSGAQLANNSSCTFTVNVTTVTAGTKNNTTSAVTSNENLPGSPASASITVIAPAPAQAVPAPMLDFKALMLLTTLVLGCALAHARQCQTLYPVRKK
jgi:hypothetical protein